MRPKPISIRKRILELYDRGKSTREIAQFWGFCVAAVRGVLQQYQERRTLEPQTHSAVARRCSAKKGSNGYSNFSPRTRRPAGRVGRAPGPPSRLPRSISGCGSSVGSLKKTLTAARRAHWHEDLSVEPTACLVFGRMPSQHQDHAPAGPRPGRAKTAGAGPARTVSDQHADRRHPLVGSLRSLAF